jgi:hypothetical protein
MLIPIALTGILTGLIVLGIPIALFRRKKNTTYSVLNLLGQFFFLIVLPLMGFAESNDACGEHPFELKTYATALTLYILPLICYFVSAYFKTKLPPVVLALLPLGIVIGLVYSLILQIHFSQLIFAIVVPVLGLPIIAPAVYFIFLLSEFLALHKYQQEQVKARNYSSAVLSNMAVLFLLPVWQKLPIVLLLCAPILALMQFILTLFGQVPDSMISMFTESCGFLLSHHQDCSCGGDHYLCSVAANGHKKLVRPVRLGMRRNEKILVNRQLMIANAFENWMEEHAPGFHRFVRRTYDSMNIPVNKWSKDKRKANVIYILMKPLEWLFLVWLYCFDRKPETRIALQYLPKQEYELYKINKTNTNNYTTK